MKMQLAFTSCLRMRQASKLFCITKQEFYLKTFLVIPVNKGTTANLVED